MNTGKLSPQMLEKIIFKHFKNQRKDTMVGPAVGVDCGILNFGDNICVVSSDPITGAVKDIGRLAVHVSCNDIASAGVEPIALMVTILAPEGTSAQVLENIALQIGRESSKLKVDIVGGHTEITNAVNRIIISCTAIGKGNKDKLITAQGARIGDGVLITKTAGLEGSSILATDYEQLLTGNLPKELIDEAKSYINHISVVEEGIIAGRFGVNAMHDVTEGGVLGAAWEIAEASKTGIELWQDSIPVTRATQAICEYFNLDPLRLISSGCMIMTSDRAKELKELIQGQGIQCEIIGKIIKDKRVIIRGGRVEPIVPPARDELYKLL